ncbi:hypothetical protein BJI67_03165 [Acidihalobacter aeolianus]|uniref:Uncharacterized protein n=2 Tax=Acidihalobacter aeolianus TaxID=2792603 RepID=A0A1D8K5G4_9GAMM|nr:hypothetical protein BJI67_03165 [Acidihalobacter aeolianus]
MHAQAEQLIQSPEEIIESSFAGSFLDADSLEMARGLMRSQQRVIDIYLADGDASDLRRLAELGLSLETLSELRDYVAGMEDWQIVNCEKLFYGGAVNLDQAQFIVGPVAKRMAELEGKSLGGFLSDVIIRWLAGVTFTAIRTESSFSQRLEDLVAVIYSQVQFLLPWGLWATDWLLEEEARNRGINYDGQVKKLAYLADAGVPNFDALSLHHMRFERVDATRLSKAYRQAGGLETGHDCIGWVLSRSKSSLETIIRGPDRRRVEHRFFERLDSIRGSRPPESMS